MEELSIAVSVGECMGETYTESVDPTAWSPTAYRFSGEPVLSDHDEIRWLHADELHTLDWAPADLPFVEALASA